MTSIGARQLPADSTNEWDIKAHYKIKTISPDFILHCPNVADSALILPAIYGEKLEMFTKSRIVVYGNFPSWVPDLFLNLKACVSRHRYILDILDDAKPFFVGVRKVRNYNHYTE